jgi:hypothetical protein
MSAHLSCTDLARGLEGKTRVEEKCSDQEHGLCNVTKGIERLTVLTSPLLAGGESSMCPSRLR